MKSITRRGFLIAAAGGLTQLLQAKSKKKSSKKLSKKRRLLFNWDGSMIHCWGRQALPHSYGPLTREQFSSLVFTPIENTGVDTVCFSFGSGNVAEYQSNVLEWPGEADRFEFPESKSWHGGVEVDPKDQYLNPKGLSDAGHNPPSLIVEECHKRGLDAFVSLRMNDIHDGQHPKGTLPNPELPSFKRINPDWLVDDLDWWSVLDYSHPRVRALKLRVVEEFFDRWDFDGIELDWLRHSLYFHRGTEKEKGKYLTEFMRAVRSSLQKKATKRGRPIEIAVRIPERIEWCHAGGFEIDQWLKEDLVDMLILGQGLTELPTLNEFRGLMKDRQLPIYPSLYCYGNSYAISPDEVIRGSAANLWNDGADGLYTFNWFLYGKWRKHLLHEIADPKRMQRKDKHYTLVQRFEASPRQPGADFVRYNTASKNAPVPLNLTVADGPSVLHIPVADDPKDSRPKSAELWLALDYSQPGDRLAFSMSGTPLTPAEVDPESSWVTLGQEISPLPGNGMIGFPSNEPYDMHFKGLRLKVPVSSLKKGRNALSIRLLKRGSGSAKPLKLRRVELITRIS